MNYLEGVLILSMIVSAYTTARLLCESRHDLGPVLEVWAYARAKHQCLGVLTTALDTDQP